MSRSGPVCWDSYNTSHKSWNTCVIFPPPQCWFGYYSRLSAPKYAWLNIGEGEGHIWVRTGVSGVNVRNLKKIQDKWLLFQRFVTSIVALPRRFLIPALHSVSQLGKRGYSIKFYTGGTAPRSNPFSFYIPFLTENAPFLICIPTIDKWYLFRIASIELYLFPFQLL